MRLDWWKKTKPQANGRRWANAPWTACSCAVCWAWPGRSSMGYPCCIGFTFCRRRSRRRRSGCPAGFRVNRFENFGGGERARAPTGPAATPADSPRRRTCPAAPDLMAKNSRSQGATPIFLAEFSEAAHDAGVSSKIYAMTALRIRSGVILTVAAGLLTACASVPPPQRALTYYVVPCDTPGSIRTGAPPAGPVAGPPASPAAASPHTPEADAASPPVCIAAAAHAPAYASSRYYPSGAYGRSYYGGPVFSTFGFGYSGYFGGSHGGHRSGGHQGGGHGGGHHGGRH